MRTAEVGTSYLIKVVPLSAYKWSHFCKTLSCIRSTVRQTETKSLTTTTVACAVPVKDNKVGLKKRIFVSCLTDEEAKLNEGSATLGGCQCTHPTLACGGTCAQDRTPSLGFVYVCPKRRPRVDSNLLSYKANGLLLDFNGNIFPL